MIYAHVIILYANVYTYVHVYMCKISFSYLCRVFLSKEENTRNITISRRAFMKFASSCFSFLAGSPGIVSVRLVIVVYYERDASWLTADTLLRHALLRIAQKSFGISLISLALTFRAFYIPSILL